MIDSHAHDDRERGAIASMCEGREYAEETSDSGSAPCPDDARHFGIAGITLRVESDLPFADSTFAPKLATFAVDEPGDDIVRIRHHFGIPSMAEAELGAEVYGKPPWVVFRNTQGWCYVGIATGGGEQKPFCVAFFGCTHSVGDIYNDAVLEQSWRDGDLASLTMFPTDQVLLARLVADRRACILHSAAVEVDGSGLLFVGHSSAGKSTIVELLRRELGERARILCDDRNIVRRHKDGFKVYGTWSHGDVPDVSADSARLSAILFLEQAAENSVQLLRDRQRTRELLLATLIKSVVDADWWRKEFEVVERMCREVPCFVMRFDKSGGIVSNLLPLLRDTVSM